MTEKHQSAENEFNPYNYNSYSDLPKDKRSEYAKTPDGGFVTKTAIDSFEEFKRQAKELNWKRTLAEKFTGQGKVEPLDLAHEKALREEEGRKWDSMIARNNEERIKTSWKQYREAVEAVEKGTFPVKKGSLVFRVVNGMKVGTGGLPETGEQVDNIYATPHTDSVETLLSYNDQQQYYYDRSPSDTYQQVAVIKVDSFEIPVPDISHDTVGDRDQVVVTGKVIEVLKPGDFFNKYEK